MPNACGKTWGGATLILSSLRDQTPHSRVTWSLLELLLLCVGKLLLCSKPSA